MKACCLNCVHFDLDLSDGGTVHLDGGFSIGMLLEAPGDCNVDEDPVVVGMNYICSRYDYGGTDEAPIVQLQLPNA